MNAFIKITFPTLFLISLMGPSALADTKTGSHADRKPASEIPLQITDESELIPAIRNDLEFHQLAIKRARAEWKQAQEQIPLSVREEFVRSQGFLGRDQEVSQALRLAIAAKDSAASLNHRIDELKKMWREARANRMIPGQPTLPELSLNLTVQALRPLVSLSRAALVAARKDVSRRLVESRHDERLARLQIGNQRNELVRLEQVIGEHLDAVRRLEGDVQEPAQGLDLDGIRASDSPIAASDSEGT